MIRLGLIGYPLEHSLSPKIHSAALKACKLDGAYSLFPIAPGNEEVLMDLLACVRAGEICGLNVTIPHKQNIISNLDELTPAAKAIGAVNTIYLKGEKLIGDNTDAAGFSTDLRRFIPYRESTIDDPKSAVVLGAGGSARAVVYALINDGWKVAIGARRIGQAREAASQFNSARVTACDLHALDLSNCSLIVNATPVGMYPSSNRSPLPEDTSLSPDTAMYDLVYNPRQTKLVQDARAQGLRAVTGLGMLVEQAALAFEIWTGHKASRDALLEAVDQRSLLEDECFVF